MMPEETIMKKWVILFLFMLAVYRPVEFSAAESKQNEDIPGVDVVTPELPDLYGGAGGTPPLLPDLYGGSGSTLPDLPGVNGRIPTPPDITITENTPEIEELIEELQAIFTLTVYYIYLDGRTAAPTHFEVLDAGSGYYVPSPVIEGYTASRELVEGIMPRRNVEYTVVYIPAGEMGSPVVPEEYAYASSIKGRFPVLNLGISLE